MNDAKIDVTGMPEFDALLDHIYEYGTASEGTIDHANTFARAIIAQARAELIAELKPVAQWAISGDSNHRAALPLSFTTEGQAAFRAIPDGVRLAIIPKE